ncbi:hypothetical protein [Bosea beijingensis]
MAGLLPCLVQKGLLKAADMRVVYETALMLLEQQATVPTKEAAFIAARAVVENNLGRSTGRKA